MKRIIITSAAVAMLAAVNVQAQDNAGGIFGNYLTDNTLRIDYIFAGDATSQEIYLDGSTGWVNDAFFTPLWLNSSTVTVAAFFGIGSR